MNIEINEYPNENLSIHRIDLRSTIFISFIIKDINKNKRENITVINNNDFIIISKMILN